MFRELKAKKAKYGFEASVSAASFIEIAEAVKEAKSFDPDLIFDVGGYTSQNYAKVYTNSEAAANVMREHLYVRQ